MRQVIQNYKSGELQLVDVPIPRVGRGFVLVRNVCSLVSVGTEKYMLEMAKKGFVGKAFARPDLVRQVFAKLKTDGIMDTYKSVMARLDAPVPLGYSCAGIVAEVGKEVEEFGVGEAVACTGSGYASHAEFVCVPQNLCVKIPTRGGSPNHPISSFNNSTNHLSFEEAAFVALGGIALEAVRLANPSLGHRVAVIGLGFLGQIAVQLLRANGCHVFGVDVAEERVMMALEHGMESGGTSGKVNVISAAMEFAPRGFDSVLILAAARGNEPLEMAAELARERGKIVAGGLVGLDVPRKVFFEKELELAVSRAWGPGVFDPLYTEKNVDYPFAYARWTAKRNAEEFLAQVAGGAIRVDHLITHRFSIDQATDAYEMILKGKEPFLGVILEYPEEKAESEKVRRAEGERVVFLKDYGEVRPVEGRVGVGLIGAGLFAQGTLLPVLKKFLNAGEINLVGVATSTGLKARQAAEKYGFSYFTSDYGELLHDEKIDAVFVLTRHGSHAHLVCEALEAGKHVFVEKPLAINEEQLKEIVSRIEGVRIEGLEGKGGEDSGLRVEGLKVGTVLMVGFNRRFAPSTRWLKERFAFVDGPLAVHITVNAGVVPPDSWVHDPGQGGGRIVGEVCHFVDLIQFFTGSVPVRVFAEALSSAAYRASDNVVITLKMEDGSIGSITYVSGGDKRYPRERVEIFGGGTVGYVENFRSACIVRSGRRRCKRNRFGIDRGHEGELEAFFGSLREGGTFPIDVADIFVTTLATFAIEESLKTGSPQPVKWGDV